MKFLVTGGRGFIGSHFVEQVLSLGHSVLDIDKMTYASNRQLPWDDDPSYELLEKDIKDLVHLPPCDVIVNFAAESHVDNSIVSSRVFVDSNILGVHNLLELLRGKVYERPIFFHISTDEVYGDIRERNFSESDPLLPSNPYSASKAAAEMLVLAYGRTYGIEYFISRSSNNYGPRQYEEKLIPKCIQSVKSGKKIPLHGDGSYIRDWLYVEDNVSAIMKIIERGEKNQIYNIASESELSNNDVAKVVVGWLNGGDLSEHVQYVENRMGQDVRYAISSEKIRSLGWMPKHADGLHKFF
jgi:dTDP-glucose 4,6-dehydratase